MDELAKVFGEAIANLAFGEEVVDLAQRAQVLWLAGEPLNLIYNEAIYACIKCGRTSWMHDELLVRFSRGM